MKTRINTQYLERIRALAREFAATRADEFPSKSHNTVYSLTYDVYYSMGVFFYLRLFRKTMNPNNFNFNRIPSSVLMKFSHKLYRKVILDLEKNGIIRVNNHYNWVTRKDRPAKVFCKSFMLKSRIIDMLEISKSKFEKESMIQIPDKVMAALDLTGEEADGKKAKEGAERQDCDKPFSPEDHQRWLRERTAEMLGSKLNFFSELTYDEDALHAQCAGDDFEEMELRRKMRRLDHIARFIKNRWYHVFHELSKRTRSNVLRLDGQRIKEVFDVTCSDMHMLAKKLEDLKCIPRPELMRFQLEVMRDFRKKFGVRRDGKCTARVKRAFKVYLNSKKDFYSRIRKGSICSRIDEYFDIYFPTIREYITKKNKIWVGITEEEFKQISVNVVKKLYTKYGVKALTCHDSVWLREDQSDIDVRRIFYDEIDLMAYNELKLDAVLENRSVFDLMAEDERRL